MSLTHQEHLDLTAFRMHQFGKAPNAKCNNCDEPCFYERGPKYNFPCCVECYEEGLYNWVDHERGGM